MQKDNSIFSKEDEVIKAAEALLKQGELNGENFLEKYKSLLKSYKKLLRQTKTVTRVSDNQQRKLNRILERLG
ncbi:MAG: hypothetical protein B6245_06980, partial [Desulfobacteraceae bacterium 4572_88]